MSFTSVSAMAAAAAVSSDTAATQAAADGWGVSFQDAQGYIEHLETTGSYFATAVAFPYHDPVHGPGVFARVGRDAASIAAWPPFNVYSESERGESRIHVFFFVCLQVLLSW